MTEEGAGMTNVKARMTRDGPGLERGGRDDRGRGQDEGGRPGRRRMWRRDDLGSVEFVRHEPSFRQSVGQTLVVLQGGDGILTGVRHLC